MHNRETEAGNRTASPDMGVASRELTVAELLDRRIEKAERLARTLNDLKQSLPASYLQSGASRVMAFIEP